MAIFPTAAAAFGAARSISQRLASETAPGRQIEFRMGIAVGELEPLRADGSADLEALLLLAAAEVAVGMPRRSGATLELERSRFPGTSPEEFVDRQPFVDLEVVERWLGDLQPAGAR